MWPFKKKPAALRRDGWAQCGYVLLGILFAFLPFFAVSPLLEETGIGWLFSQDAFVKELCDKAYSDIESSGYFTSLYYPFKYLFTDFSIIIPILIIYILWIFNLYRKLIFVDRFAPVLIHPQRIKKTVFRNLKNKLFFNLKNAPAEIFFLVVYIVFIVLVLANFSTVYYSLWGRIIDTLNSFERFTGDTFAILFTSITAKYLIPYWVLWLEVSLPVTKQIFTESKLVRRLSMGRLMARWGGVSSYINHDFDDFIRYNRKKFIGTYKTGEKNPIYLGTTTFSSDPKIGGRHFGLDTDNHMLTIAQTGGGKSRDVLHTNFALWPRGMFILDPKGEHVQRTYHIRKAMGFPVYVLDPYGLAARVVETDYLNILDEIDPNHPSAADQIMSIAYSCIPPDSKETGNAKHFRETAQMLFAGLVAHVITRYPEKQRNLTTIFDLFLSGSPDGTIINQEAFYKVLGEMAGNSACSKLPLQAVKMLLSIKEGERGSIYSTFMRSISWTQSENIKKVLSKPSKGLRKPFSIEFSLDDIRTKNATVYVVLPFSYMRIHARWLRSIISLAFLKAEFPSEVTDTDEKSLFVLDEFLQLETCKAVQDAFTTLRGSGVKLWLLSQSLSDIENYYHNYDAMISACDKQFFATDDRKDTKYLEELLGEFETIITEGQSNAPRTQREISTLESSTRIAEMIGKDVAGEGYQIVKPTDGLPVALNLTPCYWVLDQSRFADFIQAHVPAMEAPEIDEDKEKEFLSTDEVVRMLNGKSSIKPSKDKTKSKIPPRGERGALGQEIDTLKHDLKTLRDELENIKESQ